MRVQRRELLASGAAGVAAALLSGCESFEQRLTTPKLSKDSLVWGPVSTIEPAVRVLGRLGFGPRPGNIAYINSIGLDGYITQQLNPDKIPEDPTLFWRIRALGDILNSDTGLLFDEDDRRVVATMRQAAILRACYSRRQLYERMCEFWRDHFNIYAFKAQGPQLIVADDRDVIRKHAFGKFRDLLGASSKSAAMLGYLDNNINAKGVPNENYARELMELHTLGVHGGYTQHDVKEVARCLTGWTSQQHWYRGRFQFDSSRHDNGLKHVLGVTIPAGGGERDGEIVLDIVSRHPSTARHLSTKLCTRFLGHAPDDLVTKMASIYLSSDGDIRATVTALATSPELVDSAPILKRPFDFMVSALRAFNGDTDGGNALQSQLDAMGQDPYSWPMPNGFPEQQSAWINGLIPRWNFAVALAAKKIDNTALDIDGLLRAADANGRDAGECLARYAFGDLPVSREIKVLRAKMRTAASNDERAALVLMSPSFQWR